MDLATLPPNQLAMVRKELAEELQGLTASYNQLKSAQKRYSDSREAVRGVEEAGAGKEVLIPLTESLYAAATLEDTNKVMVDIGTDFMVEKTIPDAVKFFQGKMTMIDGNLEMLSKNISEKQNILETIAMLLAAKSSDQVDASTGDSANNANK